MEGSVGHGAIKAQMCCIREGRSALLCLGQGHCGTQGDGDVEKKGCGDLGMQGCGEEESVRR